MLASPTTMDIIATLLEGAIHVVEPPPLLSPEHSHQHDPVDGAWSVCATVPRVAPQTDQDAPPSVVSSVEYQLVEAMETEAPDGFEPEAATETPRVYHRPRPRLRRQ